jgi:hypothetical protein
MSQYNKAHQDFANDTSSPLRIAFGCRRSSLRLPTFAETVIDMRAVPCRYAKDI